MRNLKKILALVLALVMSLSLMATAGAAETAPADSANAYATAAKVLEGLKVLEGYPDGQMHYEDSFTRPQAAAVFYRIDTKDVANANKDLYTNAPFTDVGIDHWARGYIAYCYDNKIVKGMGDGSFGDKSPLTGYQVLVMALRELGYGQNNEFDGDNYQIKTASTATQIGLLDGVTPIDQNRLGEPATRGLMAQIVFNMLLQDTVRYNALYQNYESEGKNTLGYQKFKLEELEGVVVANEYADIRRYEDLRGYNSPMKAGETVLRTADGKDHTLAETSTKLEDLGETHVAYTVETTLRGVNAIVGLGLEKKYADKTEIVYDDGETVSNIATKAGRLDKDAQRYLNFGENGGYDTTSIKVTYQIEQIVETVSGKNAADAVDTFQDTYRLDKDFTTARLLANTVEVNPGMTYRITYKPVFGDITGDNTKPTDAKSVKWLLDNDHTYSTWTDANGVTYYRVELIPGAWYTPIDEMIVYRLFSRADLLPDGANSLIVTGEVYRGTQSVTDYSDRNSYEDFEANCLKRADEHINESINTNRLGWWLKIIDNDGDGYVDWVFQTRYTVAKVIGRNETTGALTLDAWSGTTGTEYGDTVNRSVNAVGITAKPYAGETIEEGDVVYYAYIDGVNYAWKCEIKEGKVETINRNDLTVKLVGETDPIYESAVHEHSASVDIASGVTNMSGTTNMYLYLDKYGNMAAFSQNISGNFKLLTDGWTQNLRNGIEYAVKAWDSETKSIKQYDVTEGGERFINSSNTTSDWNSWGNIRMFEALNDGWYNPYPTVRGTNFTPDGTSGVHTMVAYMETDGETARLLPVDTVYDVKAENNREIRMIDMNRDIPFQGSSTVFYAGTVYNTTRSLMTPYNSPEVNTTTGNLATFRVRALSNTTYYFVYHTTWDEGTPTGTPTVDTTGRSTYVDEVVGYTAARAYATTNSVANYIEDVYVVGTRYTDVLTGDGLGVYYTANVVVVELNNNYYRERRTVEEVFIYDFPEVSVNARYETVKAIRADGTDDKNLVIDLGLSRTYTEVTDTATGNSRVISFRPGLYWLQRSYQTNSDGIWFIVPMTHKEIRDANHYNVGTVATSTGTNSDNYVAVHDWVCKGNTGTLHGAGTGSHLYVRGNGTSVYNTANNPYAEFSLGDVRQQTANSKFYSLSYDTYMVAAMNETTASTCLREANVTGSFDNLNQVLVRYNPANSQILYAVSFAHNANTQNVWRSVLKGPDVERVEVAFLLAAGTATISDLKLDAGYEGWFATATTVPAVNPIAMMLPTGYQGDITFKMTLSADAGEPYVGWTNGVWTITDVEYDTTTVSGWSGTVTLSYDDITVRTLLALTPDDVTDVVTSNVVFATKSGFEAFLADMETYAAGLNDDETEELAKVLGVIKATTELGANTKQKTWTADADAVSSAENVFDATEVEEKIEEAEKVLDEGSKKEAVKFTIVPLEVDGKTITVAEPTGTYYVGDEVTVNVPNGYYIDVTGGTTATAGTAGTETTPWTFKITATAVTIKVVSTPPVEHTVTIQEKIGAADPETLTTLKVSDGKDTTYTYENYDEYKDTEKYTITVAADKTDSVGEVTIANGVVTIKNVTADVTVTITVTEVGGAKPDTPQAAANEPIQAILKDPTKTNSKDNYYEFYVHSGDAETSTLDKDDVAEVLSDLLGVTVTVTDTQFANGEASTSDGTTIYFRGGSGSGSATNPKTLYKVSYAADYSIAAAGDDEPLGYYPSSETAVSISVAGLTEGTYLLKSDTLAKSVTTGNVATETDVVQVSSSIISVIVSANVIYVKAVDLKGRIDLDKISGAQNDVSVGLADTAANTLKGTPTAVKPVIATTDKANLVQCGLALLIKEKTGTATNGTTVTASVNGTALGTNTVTAGAAVSVRVSVDDLAKALTGNTFQLTITASGPKFKVYNGSGFDILNVNSNGTLPVGTGTGMIAEGDYVFEIPASADGTTRAKYWAESANKVTVTGTGSDDDGNKSYAISSDLTKGSTDADGYYVLYPAVSVTIDSSALSGDVIVSVPGDENTNGMRIPSATATAAAVYVAKGATLTFTGATNKLIATITKDEDNADVLDEYGRPAATGDAVTVTKYKLKEDVTFKGFDVLKSSDNFVLYLGGTLTADTSSTTVRGYTFQLKADRGTLGGSTTGYFAVPGNSAGATWKNGDADVKFGPPDRIAANTWTITITGIVLTGGTSGTDPVFTESEVTVAVHSGNKDADGGVIANSSAVLTQDPWDSDGTWTLTITLKV